MDKKLKLLIIIVIVFSMAAISLFVYKINTPVTKIQIPTHKIVSYTQNNPDFVITMIRTNKAVQLFPGDNFSYANSNDLPIDVQGNTRLDSTNNIWVVLRDIFGNYYLQNPPVKIQESTTTWDASNILPKANISYIYFYLVNTVGNQLFNEMVLNNNWSAFKTLPNGYKELGYIELTNQYDMAYSITKTIPVFYVDWAIKILIGFAALISICTFISRYSRKSPRLRNANNLIRNDNNHDHEHEEESQNR